MKDNQVTTASAEPRIFLLSPALHCVSMTALVFLRSSFGYAFLRPKSIFFAFSWAFILYAIYAWIGGDTWTERRVLLWFGSAAVFLYWLHFSVTFTREWRSTARHDKDSGTPHAKVLLRSLGVSTTSRIDRRVRLWIEPGFILSVALGLNFIGGEKRLSAWLSLTAICLWSKEVLNQWFAIRRQKRGNDITDDLGEVFDYEKTTELSKQSHPIVSTRKSKIIRTRVGGKL